MKLWMVALDELGAECCTSTIRDGKTVADRIEHEGLPFLGVVLPRFARSLEKALEQGYVDRKLFIGFAFRAGLPELFGGFLDLVFDRKTGLLLDEPSPTAIWAVRELCLMMGKMHVKDPNVSAVKRQYTKAFRQYVECETSVKKSDECISSVQLSEFKHMSCMLWGDVLMRASDDVSFGRIIPKHGPGSTADRLLGNRKFDQTEWPERLGRVFPMSDYLIPSVRHHQSLNRIDTILPGAERPVRVIAVPKTMEKPRIIAIEPTCAMYTQQGLAESLLKHVRTDELARRFVDFDDQSPNRAMAAQGSRDGTLATLDLSEASDRLSNLLVRTMLEPYPDLLEGVEACRSRKARVPGQPVQRLAKFASMGSALCFPMETMAFITIAMLGISDERGARLTRSQLFRLQGQVRAFGDDIIVPVGSVHSVIRRLEAFGLKVNVDKSFWTGKFRESCGGDFYDGTDVSVVRVRRALPSSGSSVRRYPREIKGEPAKEILATVALRNQFYMAHMWRTARFLDQLLERVIPFPAVLSTSPVLGRWSFLGFDTERTHRTLHSPIVRGYVVSNEIPASQLDDLGALLKFFLKRSEEPFVDRKHLERYGRPKQPALRLGWSSAV